MAEYIERKARYIDIKKVTIPRGFFNQDLNVPKLFDWLYSQPTADVVEVKHGEWIMLAEFTDKSICVECSICGEEYTYKMGRIGNFVHNCYAKYNYCPNCGAKMSGGNSKNERI